jgi:DUF1009 family protein
MFSDLKSKDLNRLGLIAGSGPLPLLVLEEASRMGIPVTVAAIMEEADPGIEGLGKKLSGEIEIHCHWIGVGQLGKLIRIFKREEVRKVLMIGQVKHVRIFAPDSRSPLQHLKQLPDLKMVKMLASLKKRDTGSLLQGVIQAIEKEGFEIIDSTIFLQSLLPEKGVLTQRSPTQDELLDFEYGRMVAREIAQLDLGQTIVVKNQAVVAVEAMEGTDATIQRAAKLVGGEPLTVVKASRPNREMRFDVPVIGMNTLSVFEDCNVTALAVDAGKTLILEKEKFLCEADRLEITLVGY